MSTSQNHDNVPQGFEHEVTGRWKFSNLLKVKIIRTAATAALIGVIGAAVEREILLGNFDHVFRTASNPELTGQLNETADSCLDRACSSATNHYIIQSRKWLHRAVELSNTTTRPEILKKALSDPDLEALWPEIKEGAFDK